jgi:hypothetical protein
MITEVPLEVEVNPDPAAVIIPSILRSSTTFKVRTSSPCFTKTASAVVWGTNI